MGVILAGAGNERRRPTTLRDFASTSSISALIPDRPRTSPPNDGDHRGYGWSYLTHEAKDDLIPVTRKVERLGEALFRFKGPAFASPSMARSAALQRRVGRVGQLGWYELAEHWRNDTESGNEIAIPPEVFKQAGEYRVRARWRDETGRCGHWSRPLIVKVQ